MCSETSPPRVSFSNDEVQIQPDNFGSRGDTMLLDSCPDFEFNICRDSFHQPSSSADELFANGMILPVQLQEKQSTSLPPRPKLLSTPEDSNKESLTKMMPAVNSHDTSEEKSQSKSFWGFKRSSSLNCDIKKSLVFSLPLLSRSNSTGSVRNPKRSTSLKDGNKHSSHKHSSISKPKLSSSLPSSSCCSNCSAYQFPQKPPLKKNNQGNSYGNGGVRISPVLNVPPPYISKGTANLFGLGSFLRNGKDKKTGK